MSDIINNSFRLINSNKIDLGSIIFLNSDDGIKLVINEEIKEPRGCGQDALYCLYFATYAHQLYENRDTPLFPRNEILTINAEAIDYEVLKALGELLKRKYIDKDPEATSLLQSILYFVDRDMSHNLRVKLLMLSLGFQVLLKLNPQFPEAGLRQELRPLLHMKFSKPIELLWGFVDQFYRSLKKALDGLLDERPYFDQNPNIHIPLDIVAEKLLIYTIYEKLFRSKLIKGHEGFPTTPDDFQHIHPETVMLFFWPQDTLIKKFSLFEMPGEQYQNELSMLKSIWKKGKELEKTDRAAYHFDPLPQELEQLFLS